MVKANEKNCVKVCRFRKCTNTSRNLSLKFFAFPEKNVKKWKDACQNVQLGKLSDKTLCRFHYVCGNHFLRCDFVNILTPYKNKLKCGAVPTETTAVGKFLVNIIISQIHLEATHG